MFPRRSLPRSTYLPKYLGRGSESIRQLSLTPVVARFSFQYFKVQLEHPATRITHESADQCKRFLTGYICSILRVGRGWSQVSLSISWACFSISAIQIRASDTSCLSCSNEALHKFIVYSPDFLKNFEALVHLLTRYFSRIVLSTAC